MHPKPPAQAARPLCDGPRGRRFLIEYALESEARRHPRHEERELSGAVLAAAHHLGEGFGSPSIPAVPPARVAESIAETQLLPPEPGTILRCLQAAADEAAYWQPPSGMDNLTATAPVRTALRRVARHLSVCGMDALWSSPLDPARQWAVGWGDHPLPAPLREERAALRERRAGLRSAGHRDGMWWSIPSPAIPSSTPPVCGPAPLGLWCVEDSLGWTRAQAARLVAPEDLRVYEVGSAADWARLCARFPLDVTREAGWVRAPHCPQYRRWHAGQ